ncbi:uncharacterized protein LOC130825683 [Amaranthus tricolor]|uniref:uncharacterized protein LOC130825683 n=1 Tax=Amaranthus tricolor TaxID=29722 RepID=UPI00258BF967|nr:uncharacterized protein LOC130825683 [Amaranthus tricolor]XP_057547010.1 uncharacterized protein LOC130825683 [Amaranthus tricolor]XP_057547011.1 uncharacterized protein LOC130825683 [Amaranthus tricolor]XP_057547012.1 uncharacterized protein LOC130825683 [Amaranthus tricolor]
MDAILASTLIDQINEGNKAEGDFKPQAYQAVVDKLRNELGIFIMMDHAKNRIKVWKKHHATITDIQTYTKFTWNDEKKMLEIGMNDFAQWNEYCKDNPNASAYMNKRIENWDDICALVSVDRAIGDGALETENQGAHISDATSGESSIKKLKRDRLADAVTSFAETFKEYMISRNPPKPDSKEVYDVVSRVVGLDRYEVLKAVKRFLNNIEEFEMLKTLPESEKLDWVILCLQS